MTTSDPSTPPPNASGSQNEPSQLRLRNIAAVLVAAFILAGFAVLATYLVLQADTAKEETWARYTFLFGAVEALVFTATGWLFGREVNRQALEGAERRADQAADQVADVSQSRNDLAARGSALKRSIEAAAARIRTDGEVVERRGGPARPDVLDREMDDLLALAREWF